MLQVTLTGSRGCQRKTVGRTCENNGEDKKPKNAKAGGRPTGWSCDDQRPVALLLKVTCYFTTL